MSKGPADGVPANEADAVAQIGAIIGATEVLPDDLRPVDSREVDVITDIIADAGTGGDADATGDQERQPLLGPQQRTASPATVAAPAPATTIVAGTPVDASTGDDSLAAGVAAPAPHLSDKRRKQAAVASGDEVTLSASSKLAFTMPGQDKSDPLPSVVKKQTAIAGVLFGVCGVSLIGAVVTGLYNQGLLVTNVLSPQAMLGLLIGLSVLTLLLGAAGAIVSCCAKQSLQSAMPSPIRKAGEGHVPPAVADSNSQQPITQ